ncbi:hypothetical protein [Candidatus Protochlamydia phocaeensis]|uniref:hypothetical protein n=1 Tax=Candidatus Protochlamydia phocaeensis TaxID=1414722 RepID=UPI000837CD79|nr:hypothetical protein [Candidatus Protochlamydia phocaeensis]
MRIGDYINSCNFASELPAINNLLTSAQGSVSFWGKRVITVAGYEGSFSLDELARKVLQAGGQRSDSDDLTTQERVAGIEIRNKLENLYKVTDTKISQRNWFTRLCNWVREFTFFPYTPRFYTEDGLMENYFRGYSENKFVQEFGGVKRGMFNEYENSDGSFGPPLRIMAREEAIRAKLTQ